MLLNHENPERINGVVKRMKTYFDRRRCVRDTDWGRWGMKMRSREGKKA
jgi:hypothetical protein